MAAQDLFDNIFYKSIENIIEEEQKKGTAAEKILNLLKTETLGKMYAESAALASERSLETIEEIMYEKVLENRALDDEFMAKQSQKWGKAFVASEAMYLCVLESVDSYVEFLNENHGEEISYTYNALKIVHARAMQIYLEIITLDKNGFADGAYARWRSLYELSIISSFIKKYDEEVAKAFLESADTEDRYEWTRKAKCFKNLPKKYITFSDIQNNCELATKEWKQEYNFANKLVHASSQGTMYRLGDRVGNTIVAGKTDWGMAISAIHSAISLAQITVDFFTVFHHGDSLIAVMTLHKWVEKISAYYTEVENTCFSNKDYYEYVK